MEVDRGTYDLRDQIHSDDMNGHAGNASYGSTDDEEHSVLEDSDDGLEGEEGEGDYEDDASSSLSIPNESIDFDLVYSLHSFAATVEGQANVVKGDSLFLMDDSNSYWWLVRVLKTQEVGYIPAENIETPFERLARLNKHRNVDLASATQAELEESRDRLRNNLSSRNGSNPQVGHAPSPAPYRGNGPDSRSAVRPKSLAFSPALNVHRYPPAIWRPEEEDEEDDETEWDVEGYEDEDQDLADEQQQQMREEELLGMEPDDPMGWDDSAAEEMQRQVQQAQNSNPAGSRPGMLPTSPVQPLRSQASRERLGLVDPAEATETRKVTVTPTIARDRDGNEMQRQQAAATPTAAAPLVTLPSAVMQKQEEERKRTREEIEALEEASRKKRKSAAPITSATAVSNVPAAAAPRSVAPMTGKLQKAPQPVSSDDDSKKKKGSVFGGLFGRKKDKGKDKDKSSMHSAESNGEMSRESEDSSRSSNRPSTVNPPEAAMSPTTMAAMQQQQTQQQQFRNSTNPKQMVQQEQEAPSTPPHVSQHASQLRQKDQQQQALYQQYLNRSPSSPPEAQPNYGFQSASAVMPGNSSIGSISGLGPPSSSRPRPGSLVLSPGAMDGAGFSELSVIRVFAGNNLQTEATFKTVLLNNSTSSSELVRQAIQRFRLPFGEDEGDYYLTVKQVEGSSAVLLPDEKPLGVFETLAEAAMELPKVKRSSVGSISSIASNLSMHPAIKKLPMNDFTDDSAVKFYLNRRSEDGREGSVTGDEGDETLMAESAADHSIDRSQLLSVNTSGGHNVTPERFTSPSFRFAMQLVIYPTDLPEDMVFDPTTEAIVFKNTLRDRANTVASPGIPQTFRRKVFVFPKNVTVAEVIELGLERFGILEGVVDGGDEVEDKTTKRRSSVRVRYGLAVDLGNQERELTPSSKITDAYPHPPSFRAADRRPADKRRSMDSGQLLGTLDDVNPGDPVFILRRSISYRNSSSRRRMSAPLDEIALQQMHRESTSTISDTSEPDSPKQQRQPSRQEIIAAQRAATRANQRAILTTQTNSVRGVDVLLPGNAMIRSARYDSNDRMRYSYVEPDGETYDISDIVEEEWRESSEPHRNDLLQGAITQNKDGQTDEKLERVLSKIKGGKARSVVHPSNSTSTMDNTPGSSMRSASPSEYSLNDNARRDSRSETPIMSGRTPTPTRGVSPSQRPGSRGSRATTPTNNSNTTAPARPTETNRRQPSIASVMSDISGYTTPATHFGSTSPALPPPTPQPPRKRPLVIPKDDFGISQMMAVIEVGGTVRQPPVAPLDTVDALLFGRPLDLNSLHPKIRDVYADGFKQLDDMDKALDDFLRHAIGAF